MKRNNKRGLTVTSIVVYVVLFFMFTSITTMISSRFNKNLFDDRGTAINTTALNKLQYNLLASANESYNVKGNIEGNKTTLIFSNSDVYVFDLDENAVFKNGGKLVRYVKAFDVKLLDDIIDIYITVNKYTNELAKNIKINVHTEDYIDNGLIVHLDGINNTGTKEHDNEVNVWQDLVDENIAFKEVVDVGEATVGFNWYEDGMYGVNVFSTYNKGSFNAMTFQVTIEFTEELADYNCFLNLNTNNFLAVSKDTWFMYSGGVETAIDEYKSIPHNKTLTLTFVQADNKTKKVYYNGEEPGVVTMADSVILSDINFNNVELLGRNKAQIYKSVRVYDRALTDEEIKHNYMIDRLRFGE